MKYSRAQPLFQIVFNKHTASPNPAIVNSADYSYADRADVIIIHETLHTP